MWPEVVVPDRVQSMAQIELNSVLMLNWIVWNRTVFDLNCLLMLNWIVLKMVQRELNCVLMLNWVVWNRTVCMYKNAFGIK